MKDWQWWMMLDEKISRDQCLSNERLKTIVNETSVEINRSHRKTDKIHLQPQELTEIITSQWKSREINDFQWKINETQWLQESMEINEFQKTINRNQLFAMKNK